MPILHYSFFYNLISKNQTFYNKIQIIAYNYIETIDKQVILCYNFSVELTYRGVEQLAARRAHNPKVVSSSLTPATKK